MFCHTERTNAMHVKYSPIKFASKFCKHFMITFFSYLIAHRLIISRHFLEYHPDKGWSLCTSSLCVPLVLIYITVNICLIMCVHSYLNGKNWLPEVACVATVSSRGSSRKLGQEQKKKWKPFFCFRSNFRAITRLETLATQAMPEVSRRTGSLLHSRL